MLENNNNSEPSSSDDMLVRETKKPSRARKDQPKQRLTIDDINLAAVPYFALNEGHGIREVEGPVFLSRGVQIQITAKVIEGNEDEGGDAKGLGLPTMKDLAVHLALMQIADEQRQADGQLAADGKVYFEPKDLARRAGLGDGGSGYQRLKLALLRMRRTEIEFLKGFVDRGHRTLKGISSFALLQDMQMWESGPDLTKQSWVQYGSRFWNQVLAGQAGAMDLGIYHKLSPDFTKALYRFVSVHAGKGGEVSIPLSDLVKLLGASETMEGKELRRYLKKAATQMFDHGVITDEDPSTVVVGRGKSATMLLHVAGPGSTEFQAVVAAMMDLGFTQGQARKYAAERSADYLWSKVRLVEFVAAKNGIRKSKGGFLYRAIEHDYVVPEEALEPSKALKSKPKAKPEQPILDVDAPTQAEVEAFKAEMPKEQLEQMREDARAIMSAMHIYRGRTYPEAVLEMRVNEAIAKLLKADMQKGAEVPQAGT